MPRRAVGRRFEMRVAESAVATLGDDDTLADFGEVSEQRLVVFVKNLRSRRYAQNDIRAAGAGAILAHAMTAGLGLEMLLIAIVDQRVQAVDALNDHIATAAAVAAIRSAEFDEFLAAKRDATGAAAAGQNINLGLVEK